MKNSAEKVKEQQRTEAGEILSKRNNKGAIQG